MKAHKKISFFFPLARNTCTAQVVTRRKTYYFIKKKLKKKNTFLVLFDQKKKCSVFIFVLYINNNEFQQNEQADLGQNGWQVHFFK